MSEEREAKILTGLRELFEAIAEEARANPSFAGKVEATLAHAGASAKARSLLGHAAVAKDKAKPHSLLHNITFDPLECHIEAALINGREQEARAFLGKLDQAQLEEVVRAQRLPGAKSLRQKIAEADAASAVDAIVGSAAERVRSRLSAGR
jgi:hypothetical protein